MLKVDFRRMFTMPLVYIMWAVALVAPVLILVMTSMVSGGGEASFTSVWQMIGSVSGEGSALSMDLTGMCNINLVYFLIAVLVGVFVSDDFRSGYAKNLFTVRSKKADYVLSKTLAGFAGSAGMILFWFIGSLIGGAIAGLPFDAGTAGAGGIAACVIAKFFLTALFVAIDLLISLAAKHRTWLSVLGSLAAGMLLFTMIPMVTPLDSGILNVVLCLAGGAVFGTGLGALDCLVLNKTSLV